MTELTSTEAVSVILSGLRILNTRDGFSISDDVLEDRARNIIQALIGHGVLFCPETSNASSSAAEIYSLWSKERADDAQRDATQNQSCEASCKAREESG